MPRLMSSLSLAAGFYLLVFACPAAGLEHRSAQATKAVTREVALIANAERGDAAAQHQLGLIFYRRMMQSKLPFDGLPEAIKWFTLSERQGHIPSKAYLAFLIAWTPAPPEGRDNARAFHLAQQGAEAGDPFAQNLLASFYHLGTGVDKDDAKDAYWMRKAADGGWVKAQSDIAMRFLLGHGVDKDQPLAERYLQLAATGGDVFAQRTLGVMYAAGSNGFSNNPTKAFAWLSKAARSNDADAQYLLGAMYCEGHGTTRSTSKGKALLRKAIAQGQKDAREALGLCIVKK